MESNQLSSYNPDRSTDIQTFDKPVQFLAGVITEPQKFQGGSTTPSVEHHNIWKANNVAPVTITNFAKAAKGQVIYILGDGFTTIANNASIKTNTGAAKLLSANQTYVFVSYDNIWVEVSAPATFTDPIIKVVLGSDFSVTSGSQLAVTGFNFTPAANKTYVFDYYLCVHKPGGVLMDIRVGVNWPTGLTYGVANVIGPATTTTLASRSYGANTSGLFAALMNAADSEFYFVQIAGLVKAGATPSGNVQVTLGESNPVETVRMKAGSTLLYREV